MIKVTLICLGKLKENYLRDACSEYLKRISPFCNFKMIELSATKLPDNPSSAQISAALSNEAVQISKNIPSRSKIYAMCIEGTEFSSEKLASAIQSDANGGTSSIVFVIGSSFGLADDFKKKSNVRLSMSKMTFPHQLARVMLLEQIYRAFQINGGGKYHK